MASSGLHAARTPRRPGKSLLASAGLLILVAVGAVLGAGGTYAAWNSSTTANGSTVTSGSTALTINGVTNYTIPTLQFANLGPGQSVLVPLTLANVGTTPLSATVATTVINGSALADELTAAVAVSSTCTASTVAGTRLANFTTVATPLTLQPNATLSICLDIKMDLDAPIGVAGSSTTFDMAITATQVR
jgi:predicted ribosomally synthesized peptide with SipW-like signal peptide